MAALKGPTTAAVVLLSLLLLVCYLTPALAASGGVVGGDSWSSDSDSDSDDRYYYSDSDSDESYRFLSAPATRRVSEDSDKGFGVFGWVIIIGAFVVLAFTILELTPESPACPRFTVLKLQVGVSGTAKTLQKNLDHLSKVGSGSSARKDLRCVLTGATEALLRHSHYCVSGYSSADTVPNVSEAVECFEKMEKEERDKFDEETLVSVNNINRKSFTKKPDMGLQNEYIVVTLLVAVKGIQNFQDISKNTDLIEALQNLGSIPSDNLLALRVLWTPQEENDTLSEQDVLQDYLFLKPFSKPFSN